MLKNLYEEKRTPLTQQELNGVLLAHERYLTYKDGGLRAQLAHATLNGLNLANRNLSEADFSGASLVGANLCGSNLERASLYCADLRNCNLKSAKLMLADLRGASFNGAMLAFANLNNADLRAAMMLYAGRGGITFVDRIKEGQKSGPGVDFSNCSMKGASFGNAKLDGANFTGALLQGASFKSARLTNVTFKHAVLTGVNLKDLIVAPGALEGCITDPTPEAAGKVEELKARLEAHQRWINSSGAEGAPATLDGEDLRPLQEWFVGRSLTGLCARRTICIGVNFSGSQLQGAKFEGADLRDVDFSEADLRGASLRDTLLSHAKFEKTDLRRLTLTNGTMLAPDFSGSDVMEDQFFHAFRADDAPKAATPGGPAKSAA